MLAIPLLPILLGVLVGWSGLAGFRGALSRERGAGVRTAASLHSDEAFRTANRVAAVPTLAGAGVAVFSGIAGLLTPSTGSVITTAVLGVVGMFVLVVAGGLLGNRAAAAVPAPEPSVSPCGSCDAQSCLTGSLSASTCTPETA